MSIKTHIELNTLECIQPIKGIEICPIDQAGVKEFRVPSSHETNLVYIAPGTVEDLFVHRFQTDQLLVVRGQVVLAILQNRAYQYILMSERNPQVLKIPPGIPHGAINLTSQPCVAINSVIRHGEPNERDYRPLQQRIPYDLLMVQSLLTAIEATVV